MTKNLKKALMVVASLIPEQHQFEVYDAKKKGYEEFTSDGITVNGNVIEFNLGDAWGDLGRFRLTVEELK